MLVFMKVIGTEKLVKKTALKLFLVLNSIKGQNLKCLGHLNDTWKRANRIYT